MRAFAEGDEEAYRSVLVYRPPAALVEQQARLHFASVRLHRAVKEHGVSGRRVRDAGFDKNEKLTVNEPPTPEQIEREMEFIRRLEWKVDGEVATPVTTRPVFGPDRRTRVERTGGRWLVAFSNPDGEADDDPIVREYARAAAIHAEVFDAAAARVRAGKLRRIRQVNDFIDARHDAISRQAVADSRHARRKGRPSS
jgi:hypothetical protein